MKLVNSFAYFKHLFSSFSLDVKNHFYQLSIMQDSKYDYYSHYHPKHDLTIIETESKKSTINHYR